jgi:hypothetical protein
MEQRDNASIDTVFALQTDPKWLETRNVKRALPALVAKLLPSESTLEFAESWTPVDGGGYAGTLSMENVGQPVRMGAEFSLEPAGKGCVYRIEHHTKCSIPLLGGPVAKFAQGQVEHGCAEEFAYLVSELESRK